MGLPGIRKDMPGKGFDAPYASTERKAGLTKRSCSLRCNCWLNDTGFTINHTTANTSVGNTSAQWKRLVPTVKMFPSGGATTLIFIVDGADVVISFVVRSKPSWKMLVLDNTSIGVQFLPDANVALDIALERCFADPAG